MSETRPTYRTAGSRVPAVQPDGVGRMVDREQLKRALEAERALANAPVILSVLPGDELYNKEYPPRQFIVDGLIKRGDLVLLAGRPKSGKSWLLLQLAQAIDTGGQFLGRAATKGCVLFIALEDGERRIHERLHIRKWRPVSARFSFDMFPLNGDGLKQIRASAEPFDVIFLDTFRAACGGADENSNSEMGLLAQALADIAHETQKTVIVAHHTRKGGSDDPFELIRGAGAIRAAYDIGLLVERKGKEPEAVLRVESRDVQVEDMTIRFESSAGWTYEGDDRRIEQIRAGRRAVKAIMELGDGQTTEAIAQHLKISKQAARQQLENAERDGVVRRQAEPAEGARKPCDLWYLA